jgi:hypothetical protein
MGMSRNPFMPVGSNRDGLYGNTSPSANESTGFGLGGLGAISQTPGSRTGSMFANPYGGGTDFGSMYGGNSGESSSEIGAGMSKLQPAVSAVGTKMGPWGMLAAKGFGDVAGDLQEGGVGQHARRIAAASLIGPLVDVWDGWK